MGVIQQSVNQAFSVAGLARSLYQQSPGYQKKMEKRDFEKSTAEYEKSKADIKGALQKLPKGYAGHEELKTAQKQLEERRTDELLARGKYVDWAQRKSGRFGRIVDMSEYDERRAELANDRAESVARQVSEQNQRNRDILRQLRGLLPMSQYLVAKHKEGLNESK